jgi:DnaK suppressor protein
MDARTIERFRARLHALREAQLAQGRDHADSAGTVELDQQRQGRLSRMDALQGQQMALEAERRSRVMLQRIDGALRRLEAGEFGDCFVCGEPIPDARLEADPTTTRCRACAT